MKVKFEEEEWYPVYTLHSKDDIYIHSLVLEISGDKLKEYERIMNEFRSMQMYIRNVIDGQRSNK